MNTLLCSLMIFLLSFCWIRYCGIPTNTSFLLAIMLTVCAGYLLYKSLCEIYSAKTLNSAKSSKIKHLTDYLQFNENNVATFETCFRYYNYETKPISENKLILYKNDLKFFVVFYFIDEISKDIAIKNTIAAKKLKCSCIYFFGTAMNNTLLNLCNEHIRAHFVDVNTTFNLLKNSNQIPVCCESQKKTRKNRPVGLNLSRKRFVWFFVGALYMALISLISIMPIYTLAWASILFILSLYCLFNKRYNKAITVNFPTD